MDNPQKGITPHPQLEQLFKASGLNTFLEFNSCEGADRFLTDIAHWYGVNIREDRGQKYLTFLFPIQGERSFEQRRNHQFFFLIIAKKHVGTHDHGDFYRITFHIRNSQ